MASFMQILKGVYAPLMASYFHDPGAQAMDQWLSETIQSGDTEMAKILLHSGAKIQESSLSDAILTGNAQMVSQLLESGAKITNQSLPEARKSGNPTIIASLENHTNHPKEPKTSSVTKQSLFKTPVQKDSANKVDAAEEENQSEQNKPRL